MFIFPETEGRTLQEIENHFSGKRKLPKSLKRKEPVSDEPFPTKFDITHWESNERFEEILRKHNTNGNGHHLHPHAHLPVNNSRSKSPKIRSKNVVNDDDYDTPL